MKLFKKIKLLYKQIFLFILFIYSLMWNRQLSDVTGYRLFSKKINHIP